MPKKRSQLLKKAMNLLCMSIPIHKLKKPIYPNLISFKKTQKIKHLKLLKHYNYNYTYIEEYEFSPSGTPLFNRIPFRKGSRRRLCSMFLLCKCSVNSTSGGGEEEEESNGYGSGIESINVADDIKAEESETIHSDESEGEFDSVDQKAEKFIERFYKEMRIQRQESIAQYTEMLNRGCS